MLLWNKSGTGNLPGSDARCTVRVERRTLHIPDDILVAGSGDTVADAERDHDRNLLALLDRCRQKGIKLNRSKLCLRRE